MAAPYHHHLSALPSANDPPGSDHRSVDPV